ncbi:MAG: hypothetical protein RL026_2451 [Pseudomonadota bacterium]|jgi:hypothetical protein
MVDRGRIRWRFGVFLLLCTAAGAAVPDLSGVWLPDSRLPLPAVSELPLTEAARERLMRFDAGREDPTGFCMPLGTPRNTLAATSPMEVLQTHDRVYFVFQPNLLNAEVRRVYLDGRPLPAPEEVPPTWYGSSRGQWQGNALLVQTSHLEPQALISGMGLSHEGALRIRERWSLQEDVASGRRLVNDMTLEDPLTFTRPVQLRRVFHWAPHAQFGETNCSERLWIDSLWRQRLAEHAEGQRVRPAGALP